MRVSHVLAGLLAAGAVMVQPAVADPSSERAEQLAASQADLTESLAGKLWEWAELGYQEDKSTQLLQDTLAREEFEVEAGVAGIPTAFIAEYGSGEPVLAVLAEFDALPGINQDAVPQRSPIPGKGAGQACGHNLFGAGSVSAAIAIRHWLEERGRSALDGVEAFNMMANMMHEHMPQDARMHYVITEGGEAPNVVPDFAEVFYYVRHPDADGVEAIWERLEKAAEGAAMGTGTTVEWEIIHGNNPLLVNEKLARMMDEKLREAGGITYTPEEQAFAEQIAESFTNPELELGSEEEVQPFEVSLGYGSTDVGDVSWAVPTVGLRTATWVPGTSAHSWQAVAASGMSIGHKGAELAAKTLTMAAVEIYQNEDLVEEAWAEFEQKRGPDYEYKSLLGDREPPLDYRK